MFHLVVGGGGGDHLEVGWKGESEAKASNFEDVFTSFSSPRLRPCAGIPGRSRQTQRSPRKKKTESRNSKSPRNLSSLWMSTRLCRKRYGHVCLKSALLVMMDVPGCLQQDQACFDFSPFGDYVNRNGNLKCINSLVTICILSSAGIL